MRGINILTSAVLVLLSVLALAGRDGVPGVYADEPGSPAPGLKQGDLNHKENRLALSASPYLRSARFQLIDWHEYGEEAFALARRLDRPILLDIGAIWCHWCHVMDEETYADPEVARLINEYFVAIKVDMDQMPDIDRWYQNAVMAISGHGGWPLTAFLTPDGKVFFGGTYFPAEDKWGRKGFRSLLPSIATLYREGKDELLTQAEEMSRLVLAQQQAGLKAGELSPELLDSMTRHIAEDFDLDFGGFGTGTKFPSESGVEFALWRGFSGENAGLLARALQTVDAMAEGGIRDHIRGGFFRYAMDREWRVPHFEKMSYVNSGMLINFVHAYAATGNAAYKDIVEDILDYIDREASDGRLGGFYASQDADVGRGDDGDFYTWTPAEVDAALSPLEAKVIKRYYGIEVLGEMRHNRAKNVPRISAAPEEIAGELGMPTEEVITLINGGREEMRESRGSSTATAPFVDKSKYSSRNGMMISAFLEVYKFTGREDIKKKALKSLDFLLANSYGRGEGVLHATYPGGERVPGFLDDNVQMSMACLDAYEVSGYRFYLEAAEDIMGYCLNNFWDEGEGGFFDTALAHRRFARKPFEDVPTPGANAVAAMVLDRLFYMTGRDEYRERAGQTLRVYAGSAGKSGHFASTYALALGYHITPPPHAAVIGRKDDPDTWRLLKAALGTYRPGKIVTLHDPIEEEDDDLPYPPSADGTPVAYVCIPLEYCAPPTPEASKVSELLQTLGIE